MREEVVAELQENVCTGHSEYLGGDVKEREKKAHSLQLGRVCLFTNKGLSIGNSIMQHSHKKKPTWYPKHATWERTSSMDWLLPAGFNIPRDFFFSRNKIVILVYKTVMERDPSWTMRNAILALDGYVPSAHLCNSPRVLHFRCVFRTTPFDSLRRVLHAHRLISHTLGNKGQP